MSEVTERLRTAIADRYVIERELGQGGMASVYLAQDVKHDRKVALKVLRPELAAVIGAERFLNEIKVTANLQHPHILPLHDSGEADSFLYYVMPFVEGDTLRDHLNRQKQLGIEEAIQLARGVAAALDYAHRHGVIHRDIKPENILLHDGQPVVADFGIALAVSAAGGSRLTETGLSIGTPHYMSPEQAMGDRELDARSDVYSLGAVLYEMLTGDPPYTGSTAQAIVAKVITEKPPSVTVARDTVPPHVAKAITRALAKLPADRFPSATSFAEALVRPGLQDTADYTTMPGEERRPRDWRAVAVVGAFVTVAALGAWGWLRPAAPPPAAVTRFDLVARGLGSGAGGRIVDVSRDGSVIAWVAIDSAGRQMIFLRRSDALVATAIPGTEAALQPFFSPDGEWLGFTQESDIRKVRLSGGAPITVVRDAAAWGPTWGAGNQIIYARVPAYDAMVVSGNGGTPRLAASPPEGMQFRWPELLPDGQAALVTLFGGLGNTRIAVLDLESGTLDSLLDQATHARYVPTGHLLYGHPEGGVFSVPFDARRRRLTGDPVPVIEDVQVYSGGATQFAVSQTGTMVHMGGARAALHLMLVDMDGREGAIEGVPDQFGSPRFSPDGRRIALTAPDPSDAGRDVYILDLVLGTRSRLTFGGTNLYPFWSLDGKSVIFSSESDSTLEADVYRKAADGSGAAERLLRYPGDQYAQALTADGRLVVRSIKEGGSYDLEILSPGDTVPRPWLSDAWSEFAATLSPDERWMAYTSDQTGAAEVYVTAFPTPAGRWQISQGGGNEAMWSRDGRTLFYWAGDQLMAASVERTPTFQVTGLRRLFQGTYDRVFRYPNYDMHPDGRSFVMIKALGQQNTVTVVTNWFAELEALTGGR